MTDNEQPRFAIEATFEDLLGVCVALARNYHEDGEDPLPDTFGQAERCGLLAVIWPLWDRAPAQYRVAIGGTFADLGVEWSGALDAALSAARTQALERLWEQGEQDVA